MRFPTTKHPVINIQAVKIEEAALKSIKISLAKLWLGLILFQHMIWPKLHAMCRARGSAGLWFGNRG